MRYLLAILAVFLLAISTAAAAEYEPAERELSELDAHLRRMGEKLSTQRSEIEGINAEIERLKRDQSAGVVDVFRLRTLQADAQQKARAIETTEREISALETETDRRREALIAELDRTLDFVERSLQNNPGEELAAQRNRLMDVYLRHLIKRYERFNFKPVAVPIDPLASAEDLEESIEFIGLQRKKLSDLMKFLEKRIERFKKEKRLREFVSERGLFEESIDDRGLAVAGGAPRREGGIPEDGYVLGGFFDPNSGRTIDEEIGRFEKQLEKLKLMDGRFAERQEEIRAEAVRRRGRK